MKLVKRGNVWWVDYTAGGKRIRTSTGARRKEEAEAWMSNIKVARRMPTFSLALDVLKKLFGVNDDDDSDFQVALPIDAIWDTYVRIATATGKYNYGDDTKRKRRCHLNKLVEWLHAKRPTIVSAHMVNGPIAAQFAEYINDGKTKTKTRRNILGDLGAVWNILEKASEGIKNPWTHLSPQDTDSEIGKAFTEDEERLVLEAAKKEGKQWWEVCQVMRMTGLRYSSVARLRWDEFDLEARVLRHKPPKTIRHNIVVTLPIIDELMDVINGIPRNGDFLFPVHSELYGHRGKKTTEGFVFANVLERAGIKGAGYTIHSWRHTAATRLAAAGTDKETRKMILGHTTDENAERYDHFEHLAEKRKALEAASGITCPSTPSA